MDIYRVENFEVKVGAIAGYLILVDGDERYKAVLRRAFPLCQFSHSFPDRFGRFKWGTYIRGKIEKKEVEQFLHVLVSHFCIFDEFDECHVLDRHWTTHVAGGYQRTEIGSIVYKAKPYPNRTGDSRSADLIVKHLKRFILSHPTYARTDIIVPVPSRQMTTSSNLPCYLAGKLAKLLECADGTGTVDKTRETHPQKDVHTHQEKVENVSAAFKVVKSLRNKRVLVLDDLYQSGATINEVGRVIRENGAIEVLGLAVTKTHRDV